MTRPPLRPSLVYWNIVGGDGPHTCYFEQFELCLHPGALVHRGHPDNVERSDAGDTHHIDNNHSNNDPANLAPCHHGCHVSHHMRGVLKTGGAAKGVPKTGGKAKGVPATGGKAKGVPAKGLAAKGMPKTGRAAKGMPGTGRKAKGVPNTGGSAKGYHHTDAAKDRISEGVKQYWARKKKQSE